MLNQNQRRDLFATLAKTAALWRDLFESWSVEDVEGAHEDPNLKQVPDPEANGNGRKKVELLSERRPGGVTSGPFHNCGMNLYYPCVYTPLNEHDKGPAPRPAGPLLRR